VDESADRVLFKTDLARRYGKSRETIWRWIKSGRLPAPDVRVAGQDAWREATIRTHEARN
jgi:predicted DNA-binding transcriptional regulator AlpA